MKKLFYTSIIFLVLFYSRGYSQNNWLPSLVDMPFNFKAVTFVDENTGYIVGEDNEQFGGTILKTINAGLSWDHSYTRSGVLNSVSFPSSGIGYVCSSDGLVGKTTNAGQEWVFNAVHTSQLNSIFFTDNNNGFAVGGGGAIYKTINGGQSWTLYNTGINLMLTGVFFVDANIGYVCGYNFSQGGAVIIKTVNAGAAWTLTQTSFNKFNKIYFFNESTGFAVGIKPGNAIWKTTNGGQSWTEKYVGFSSEPNDIFFSNINIGIVVAGNGLLIKSMNGGENWVPENSNTTKNLTGVWLTGNNEGYIVGLHGLILKNNNIANLGCGTHKVYVCHNGHTICVDTHAVHAHLGHGDYLGQCNDNSTFSLNQNTDNFKLFDNYPNPFNPSTRIKFYLSENAFTKLLIYDILGNEVARLADGELVAGYYEYEWDASKYASGVYYYKIETSQFTDIKKMVLMK